MGKRNWLNIHRISHQLWLQILIGITLSIVANGIGLIVSRMGLLQINYEIGAVKELLILQIQFIGIFAALVFTFYIFSFQSIENRKLTIYLKIRDYTDKLSNLALNLPDKYLKYSEDLNESLKELNEIRLNSYVPNEESGRRAASFLLKMQEEGWHYSGISGEDSLIDYICDIMLNIEEFVNQLGIIVIEIICSESILKSIKKMITYIIILFLGIAYLHLAESEYELSPILRFAIASSSLIFSALFVAEMVNHLSYHYMNVKTVICDKEE